MKQINRLQQQVTDDFEIAFNDPDLQIEQVTTSREGKYIQIIKKESDRIDWGVENFGLEKQGDSSSKDLIKEKTNQKKESQKLGKSLTNRRRKSRLHETLKDPFNEEEMIITDSYITFNVRRFFKFFVYHFIQFFMLGPLFIFVMLLIEGKTFIYNMGFFGFTRTQLQQMLHFQCFIGSFCMYYFSDQNLNFEALIMAGISSFIKTIVIAFRYATASETRIKNQYLRRFTSKDNATEYLAEAWRDIKPQAIDNEIKSSMVRNEIEMKTFQLTFLSKISGIYQQKLLNFNYYNETNFDAKQNQLMFKGMLRFFEQIEQIKSTKNVKIQPTEHQSSIFKDFNINLEDVLSWIQNEPTAEDLLKKYSGRLFFKECVLSGLEITSNRIKTFTFQMLCLIHALLPFLITLINDLRYADENPNWHLKYTHYCFWLYLLATSYINGYICYQNADFLDIAFLDLSRRHFFMKVLSNIVQPNRFKIRGIYKVFPLLNIFDSKSILGWLDMRILTLDIGLRFYIRIQLYSTVYIIIYTILGALYLSFFFGLSINILTQDQWYSILFEIVAFWTLIIAILIKGALINSESDKQIMRITELRNILERVYSDWDLINDDASDNDFLNNTFQIAHTYFKCLMSVHSEAECKQHLRESIRVLQSVQERIEKENFYNPIRFLGIPITSKVIYAIFTGIGSLLLAILKKKTHILD